MKQVETQLEKVSESLGEGQKIQEQIRSLKDTEEKLLKLFEIYQEQFWLFMGNSG